MTTKTSDNTVMGRRDTVQGLSLLRDPVIIGRYWKVGLEQKHIIFRSLPVHSHRPIVLQSAHSSHSPQIQSHSPQNQSTIFHKMASIFLMLSPLDIILHSPHLRPSRWRVQVFWQQIMLLVQTG